MSYNVQSSPTNVRKSWTPDRCKTPTPYNLFMYSFIREMYFYSEQPEIPEPVLIPPQLISCTAELRLGEGGAALWANQGPVALNRAVRHLHVHAHRRRRQSDDFISVSCISFIVQWNRGKVGMGVTKLYYLTAVEKSEVTWMGCLAVVPRSQTG